MVCQIVMPCLRSAGHLSRVFTIAFLVNARVEQLVHVDKVFRPPEESGTRVNVAGPEGLLPRTLAIWTSVHLSTPVCIALE